MSVYMYMRVIRRFLQSPIFVPHPFTGLTSST